MWIKAYLSRLALLLTVLAASDVRVSHAAKCDRTPEGTTVNRSPSDGRFKLRILGDPDSYVAGENYTSKSFRIYLCLFY